MTDSICRGCGAVVVWATTEHGKKMPLNPQVPPEHNRGNVAFRDDVAYYVHDSERADLRDTGELIFESHFATCPNKNRER